MLYVIYVFKLIRNMAKKNRNLNGTGFHIIFRLFLKLNNDFLFKSKT